MACDMMYVGNIDTFSCLCENLFDSMCTKKSMETSVRLACPLSGLYPKWWFCHWPFQCDTLLVTLTCAHMCVHARARVCVCVCVCVCVITVGVLVFVCFVCGFSCLTLLFFHSLTVLFLMRNRALTLIQMVF